MKKMLALLLVVMMILSMAACGSKNAAGNTETKAPAGNAPAASGEKVTINFDSWSNVDSGWTDCYTAIYEEFHKQYGDTITINPVGNSYADTLSTLLLQASAGNTPDVAMVKAEWLPQLMELDCLADIKPYISEEALADYGEASLSSYTTADGSLVALPYMTVMILAGLQSVDSSLLEAACIDGGNPFQRFWHIVLPSIRPVLFTSVWLAITQNFQQFTIINNMTGGGPVDATTTLSIAAYKAAFQSYNFGESAAIGVIWMVFLFVLTFISNKANENHADTL